MRVFAASVIGQLGAEEVFVSPTHTFVAKDGALVRYENGPELREALDRYLLTGDVPDAGNGYSLLPPTPGT